VLIDKDKRAKYDQIGSRVADDAFRPRSIRQYGNAMLLHRAMQDILPLLKEGAKEVYF
jgi:hypothetical protein